MNLVQRIRDTLTARFMKGMLATKKGQAHILNQVADAEATDEGAIFDRLLAHVTDPKLRQIIERHQADELRHAQMFLGCMARTGIAPSPVPDHLKLLDRLDALAGNVMGEPVRSDEDVMQAYLMLLVIEERAIHQFTAFIRAFDLVDRETADVFRAIAHDEERHLRYCHAISKRYAPDTTTWERELGRFRVLEAKAFAENTSANLEHTFHNGLHSAGPVERMLWRGITRITSGADRMKPREVSFDLAAVGS
ncbi:MAG: ferritin-like domain-containing protein [Polyangia bacterium]